MKLTKAQTRYLYLCDLKGGLLATMGLQRKMQTEMYEADLIRRDSLGYYVPTDKGREVLLENLKPLTPPKPSKE